MALGDATIVNAQSRTQYVGSNTNLIGQAFDAVLDVQMGNSNILSQLQGPEGSDKPFIVKTDLEKGAMDTVNFASAANLGAAGRRGTQRAVNFEEPLFHGSWSVKIDNLRVVVAWNELLRWAATTGQSWQSVYPTLVGERVGQIEQEDMLARLRQRSSTANTVRPGSASTLDTLRYTDTVDTYTLGLAYGMLQRNGAKPANVGTMTGGMPLNSYVALGTDLALEPLWQDPTFTNALQNAGLRGPTNPIWTNDIPMWRGLSVMRWNVVAHDNPGPIGSIVQPEALTGVAVTSGTGALTLTGGGTDTSALGDVAALYKPFEYFYGCNKLLGESISTGSDSNVYYFVIIDPADGKWCMYSYTGSSAFTNNGQSITTTNRLAASASSTAVTTLGNVSWDGTVNKEGTFPIGSTVVQVNANGVPVCDSYLFGSNVGGKCYGTVKNQRIQNVDDYGALQGKGIWSIYGQDVAADSRGGQYRRFVRLQSAYVHPMGKLLPQI